MNNVETARNHTGARIACAPPAGQDPGSRRGSGARPGAGSVGRRAGGGGQCPAAAGRSWQSCHRHCGRPAHGPDRRRRLAAGDRGQHRLCGRQLRHRPPGGLAGRQQHGGAPTSWPTTSPPANCSLRPALNAQALSIAASPDGSRIYVGGDFTSVNGAAVWRVAALNPVTGALISTSCPRSGPPSAPSSPTTDTVYLGGLFTAVGIARGNRLAAVRPPTAP